MPPGTILGMIKQWQSAPDCMFSADIDQLTGLPAHRSVSIESATTLLSNRYVFGATDSQ